MYYTNCRHTVYWILVVWKTDINISDSVLFSLIKATDQLLMKMSHVTHLWEIYSSFVLQSTFYLKSTLIRIINKACIHSGDCFDSETLREYHNTVRDSLLRKINSLNDTLIGVANDMWTSLSEVHPSNFLRVRGNEIGVFAFLKVSNIISVF